MAATAERHRTCRVCPGSLRPGSSGRRCRLRGSFAAQATPDPAACARSTAGTTANSSGDPAPEGAGPSRGAETELDGPIDIFDVITFGRTDHIGEILPRDPAALERPLARYAPARAEPSRRLDPTDTPIAFAVAAGADRRHVARPRGCLALLRIQDEQIALDLGKVQAGFLHVPRGRVGAAGCGCRRKHAGGGPPIMNTVASAVPDRTARPGRR